MKIRTDKLWLRNTSRYDDRECMPLIRAAYASMVNSAGTRTVPRIIVKLTNCQWGFRGRAAWTEWHRDSDFQSQQWKRVLVRIGSPKHFPCSIRDSRFKADMPEYELRTYREAIVAITAHEIEHAMGTPGGYEGEFKCELAASDAVDYYRANQERIDREIQQALDEVRSRAERQQALKALESDPVFVREQQLEKARRAEARWTTKLKRALSKCKHYARTVKRLEKQIERLTTGQELLAAKQP